MSDMWPNVTVDFTDHDKSSSLFDPNYTYSNDKYVCIRGFYFAHVVCNYLVFLSGAACLASRVAPWFKGWHPWFGRVYILSMLWSTVTSTLITNTGLPLSTIISFGAVMGGLTIGWIVIIVHGQRMDRAAMELVQAQLVQQSSMQKKGLECTGTSLGDGATPDLNLMLREAKKEVADSRTFRERFVSLKALHGTLFFVSWTQIAGRIFASNQSGDFTCHTYPIYKPIDTAEGNYDTGALTLVPVNDPDWDRLPWSGGVVAWSLQIILGSMAGALVVGAVWSWRSAALAVVERRRKNEDEGRACEKVLVGRRCMKTTTTTTAVAAADVRMTGTATDGGDEESTPPSSNSITFPAMAASEGKQGFTNEVSCFR